MYSPFSRTALFLVAICGWGILFFGGWIAVRGIFFYAADPVLMGTGGGLAIGGLLVVALTVGANAQVSTARDTAAVRAVLERQASADRGRGKPEIQATRARDASTPKPRAEPRMRGPEA